MIDRKFASDLANEMIGRPQDDPDRPWSLEEFPEGWLIVDLSKLPGARTTVIERSGGRIMHFPSGIAPDFIVEDYGSFAAEGREGSVTDFR